MENIHHSQVQIIQQTEIFQPLDQVAQAANCTSPAQGE